MSVRSRYGQTQRVCAGGTISLSKSVTSYVYRRVQYWVPCYFSYALLICQQTSLYHMPRRTRLYTIATLWSLWRRRVTPELQSAVVVTRWRKITGSFVLLSSVRSNNKLLITGMELGSFGKCLNPCCDVTHKHIYFTSAPFAFAFQYVGCSFHFEAVRTL